MRMSIEEFEEYAKSHNILTMTRELYENRLKADLVAMLTELQLEIDELTSSYEVPNIYVEIGMKEIENEIQDLIQQKINLLRSKD